jgi:hypothetical protein
MSRPEPPTPPTPTPATAAKPEHPHVRVRLSGGDGNVHIIIGKVAVALRRQVGDAAADAFNAAAYQCGSYDEVLQLVMRTVRVS